MTEHVLSKPESSPEVTSGQRMFFFQPLFYSWRFLVVSGFFALVLGTALYILCTRWNSLPHPELVGIFLIVWSGALPLLVRAIRQHAQIRDKLAAEKPHIATNSSLDALLLLAETALMEGLSYTFTTMLILLFLVLHCFGVKH